ncbi:MAG: ABC transporter permease [Candidatus Hodarchaeota archaeon]
MKRLKKYTSIMKTAMQSGMSFKFSFFMSMFVFIFPLLAMIFFWTAIYETHPSDFVISGYTFQDMVTYLLLYQFIFEISWLYVHWDIKNDITSGRLTGFLMKPLNYPLTKICGKLGNIFLPRFISAVIIFPLLMFLFRGNISIRVDAFTITFGIISTIICCALLYIFQTCLGLVSFWLEDAAPAGEFWMHFLGGFVIPLDILPGWLQWLSSILPFKYAVYTPVKIFMGIDQAGVFMALAIQLAWILVLTVLAKYLWKHGLRRYQAYGG